MTTIVTVALGSIATTYLFLRFLLHITQDAREPPVIETKFPFLGPLVGMYQEKSLFYVRLRDKYKLPIYTLRMPFSRMYIVNATELIPALQKQWRTISFAAIAADAGKIVGISKKGLEILRRDLTSEHGFSVSWPKYIMPAMGPGEDLNAINRRSIEVFSADMEKLRAHGTKRVGLSEWSRQIMVDSTTEAIWGPDNPYRDPVIAEAWRTFEKGFLTLLVFPYASLLFPKLIHARELLTGAMIGYLRMGGHEKASGLVRRRFEHHQNLFGLGLEDIARGEIANTFAVLGNSTPCSLWVLYHIFSDEKVLADVRCEVSALVREENDENGSSVSTVDLAGIRDSCPILLSTFQETLRYRALATGPRVLLEDVLLEGRILLKKGNMLMIPAPVQHTDIIAWGEDAREFDHLRFVRNLTSRHKKPNRVAFRAFGGGHVLCPGRHFASTEIMALAALLVLQFDVVPVAGKWIEPTWEKSPVQAGFPIIDEDINVELRPREPERKWNIIFTGSDKAMGIVSEDSIPGTGS